MKKYIMALTILGIFGSGTAFADDSQITDASLAGTVSPTCTISPMTQFSADGANLGGGATSTAATVNLTGLANATTAMYEPGVAITLNFTGMCNYVHNVGVQTTTGNLKAVTAANAQVASSLDFIKTLDYAATINWGNKVGSLSADGTAMKKSPNRVVTGSYSGTGSLVISITDPSAAAIATQPLIAGTWSDTLTLKIGAAL